MKQLLILLIILTPFVSLGTLTKVTRIIDGDTFETEKGEKVRIIGINAPEITDIFGEEAKTHLSQLIEGQIVDLLPDQISNDRDRYNRLLRYVILNGRDINKQMILDGYAFAYLKYHFDKQSEYKEAQVTASNNSVGIWNKNKKDTGIKTSENEKKIFWASISPKVYFIITLILLLIVIGLWYYFKK
jgi:micrococcal nuclease